MGGREAVARNEGRARVINRKKERNRAATPGSGWRVV